MATRLPKSERSPSPPPDQRDAVIQELRKGTELAELLRRQLELIPELDRRDHALANVSDISMSLRSSLSALQYDYEREHCGSSSVAGPAIYYYTFKGAKSNSIVTTTPENDGFHWRKYGEKKILNTDFPRLYYRCGYSDEHQPSSSSTNSQVLDFTKASISSPMDPPVGAPILKEEEEEGAPSIDESTRIMSTVMPSYGAYDYDELSPQSWGVTGWQ
ncbi:hypothetical protein E2562_036238 [Oryza meyeriana var. granulata]|uniref:WRKY domain-containing protein n=1 Tax=Oryza meyeriana var. granulata TaxID=110450 RepID=A0A6G1ET36_9ORYZ|nr:hypothetical protein E2562_036238 [Oryza meyeriana var. granulata]